MPEVMSVEQAAEFLPFNEDTLRRMARRGDIPASKMHGKWLFIAADLVAWVRAAQAISADPLADNTRTSERNVAG